MAVDRSSGASADDNRLKKRLREEGLMSLFEHIGELRKRVIVIFAVLVLSMVAGLLLADPAYRLLMAQEPVKDMELHAFSLWDGIGMYMKFAFVIALLITIPVAFYQIWSFVKPGLHPAEQRATVRYVPYAALLFVLGLSFAYFVIFPMAFGFTTTVSRNLGLEETYGVTQYFAFMFNILIPVSLLFELPLVIMFLTKLRIVTPQRLKKMRRVAYFIMVLIGTTITPPDVISDILVSIPLIVLYEASLFFSGIVYRKQQEKDAAREREYGELESHAQT
ncbi:subunit TatC of preprotein translocase [Paenibacillus sp. 32O-W]|nr:twin-arginine translocase subunit TatC [Paenibacillus sp. 32O-W]ALS29653.1 subunit TatC of preprotein translocase [Paenibacillus sp. 32O-W]